jgi:transcriptional regulator with XRE-family HTH domain
MSWSSQWETLIKLVKRQEAALQIDPTKLVEARLARAMSQEEAAIATDLSARTIQRIEAGHPASLESTKALLTIFGTDIIHDPEAAAASVPASPWRAVGGQIAGASRRTAVLGFAGIRLLFVANFILVALAKPFLPEQTGLWVGGEGFVIGTMSQPPVTAPEVLGYWIIPLMLLAAAALLPSYRAD